MFWSILLLILGMVLPSGTLIERAIASDPAKIVGPAACAECHKQEAAAWKLTHHYKTFRDMPRNPEGNTIAKKMGVRRIKLEDPCKSCHFTVQSNDSGTDVAAGISCESCHGAARDWLKIHNSFSGKTATTETKAEEAARWKLAESKGMIRPHMLQQLARNCYSCHVVPQEELVNKGGHKHGSAFELVSWSQGEVRHNTWYSKGAENQLATPARKRLMYLAGLGVELEVGLRAIGDATARRTYAFEMAKRVDKARNQLAAAAKVIPDVPEVAAMVQLSHSAGLQLRNDKNLTAAADGISQQVTLILKKYDGSTLQALDSLIPGPDKFLGKARKAGEIN